MLHGWMDVSASFQFVVDALEADWHVIAPDWRGFGLTEWRGDAYWFPDYLGDLDACALAPDEPLRLVGHSLGGNVASLYAGVRPARVSHWWRWMPSALPIRSPSSPGRIEKWLAELAAPAGSGLRRSGRAGCPPEADNPRLEAGRAAFLAGHLGEADGEGGFRLAGDPAHRRVNPVLYRRAEAMAAWRRVTAPVLWVEPAEPDLRRKLGVSDEAHAEARACFRDFREVQVADCGHNLHHDQPDVVARIIESFLLSKES
jgi:pimeloyl-ACP methyl ester carboxylesterase